jgi:hypothetical protein
MLRGLNLPGRGSANGRRVCPRKTPGALFDLGASTLVKWIPGEGWLEGGK